MSGETGKQYAVNWNNHMNHIRNTFEKLFASKDLTDVTLYCEGRKLGAHKVLLSACSTYFRDVFNDIPCEHPVIILKGVTFQVLEDILRFIYKGEVSIDSENFDNFIKTAQLLQVSGLTESNDKVLSSAFQSKPTSKCQGNSSSHIRSQSPEINTEPPPLKRIKQDDEGTSSSNTHNIKSEPKELDTFEEEKFLDPLQSLEINNDEEQYSESDGKFANSILNLNSVEETFPETEYKPGVFQFESVYVDSDCGSISINANSSSQPAVVRQSAFSESSLKCSVCAKVFSHPYSLHHHKAVHSGSTECPICHAVLSRKYNLKIHMKARHNV